MNNKTFDSLKWIAIVVIPALGTFVGVVGQAFNWSQASLAVTIIAAFGTFLGTILGVSHVNYKNN
ncbi:phage holin [Melissococcus plutonius]|uniref:phage holin n=1 Tax=Melissococcus plutonius TaxID=33970 RepID=UPI0021E61535|nr:phage holin [Melissococcus plutonius]MCV2506029.1 phage holin [Melissococcus plutonius]